MLVKHDIKSITKSVQKQCNNLITKM